MNWVGCLEVRSLSLSHSLSISHFSVSEFRCLGLGYLNPIVIYVEGGCCGFVMMVIFISGNFDKDEE